MEKILNNDGTVRINGEEIEVSDLNLEPKVKPMKKEVLEECKKKFDNNPISKANNVIAVDKSNHYEKKDILFWKIFSIALVFILVFLIAWANVSFSQKDFSPQVNNTINVEPASVTVPVKIEPTSITAPISNNYTINNQNNVTVNIDKEFIKAILNLSNHS
jgi:hypothetical protein